MVPGGHQPLLWLGRTIPDPIFLHRRHGDGAGGRVVFTSSVPRPSPPSQVTPLGSQGTRSASAADRIGSQASPCQSATGRIGVQATSSRPSVQPLGRQSAFRPSRPGRLGLQAIVFRTATDVLGPQATTAGSAPDRLGAQSACFPTRSSSLGIHFGNFPPNSGHFGTVGTYLTEIRATCTIVIGSLTSSG